MVNSPYYVTKHTLKNSSGIPLKIYKVAKLENFFHMEFFSYIEGVAKSEFFNDVRFLKNLGEYRRKTAWMIYLN